MDWDHLAEDNSQSLFASWLKILLRESPALPLKLAQQYRPNVPAIKASEFTTGSYNICCTVTFADESNVLVRFPILGCSRFRLEKINDELLTMGYLARFTRIPVPAVLATGKWKGGPYIITSVIEGTLLSNCLRDPGIPGLKSSVSDSELERAYCGMAHVMLELSKPTFPVIGCLRWQQPGGWGVTKRPLTLNMNELIHIGNYPSKAYPEDVFRTASEYFQELAKQQFLHLKYQCNDVVKDEDDCRKKYIVKRQHGNFQQCQGYFTSTVMTFGLQMFSYPKRI